VAATAERRRAWRPWWRWRARRRSWRPWQSLVSRQVEFESGAPRLGPGAAVLSRNLQQYLCVNIRFSRPAIQLVQPY